MMIKYSIRGENPEATEAIVDYKVSNSKDRKYFQAEQESWCRVNFEGECENGWCRGDDSVSAQLLSQKMCLKICMVQLTL